MNDDEQNKIEWQRRNQEASAHGEESYPDPKSGLPVMTSFAHKKRGYCCKSGCRHCPYGFEKNDLKQ